jgi:hypothetical protein
MKLKHPEKAYEAFKINNADHRGCMEEAFDFKHCEYVNGPNCLELQNEFRDCRKYFISAKQNLYAEMAYTFNATKAISENLSSTVDKNIGRGTLNIS